MSNYTPKPESENVNYGSETTLFGLLKLFVSCSVIICFIVIMFGLGGEFLLVRLNPWFEGFAFGSKSIYGLSGGDFSEGKKILNELVGSEADKFKVILVCDDMPNAFAIPGFVIAVTSKAVKNIRSEQGLAFVLGHEYGHFVDKDHLRGLGFHLGVALSLSLVGLDEIGSWISNLSSTIISRRFSQAQESAADAVALELLRKKYGSVEGASEFFEYLAAKHKDGLADRVFSTHPLTTQRIAHIKNSALPGEKSAIRPLVVDLEKACANDKL